MNALGLLIILAGGFLLSSALQNKSPMQTLKSIVQDPKTARTTLATRGEEYSSGGVGSNQGNANGGGSSSGEIGGGPQAAAAIAYARAQLGKPYKYGATGPDAFDCSGLVQAAYKSAGVSLPRTTQQMCLKGTGVKRVDLVPGDLVFPTIAHVGIYTGNGNIIDAPRTGSVVKERPIWGFWQARRVVDESQVGKGGM